MTKSGIRPILGLNSSKKSRIEHIKLVDYSIVTTFLGVNSN